MPKKIVFSLLVFFIFSVSLTAKQPYVIFDSEGNKVQYKSMIDSLGYSDVVLFGEIHDNTLAHWLQLEVTKDIAEWNKVILGAEMFETDEQEYLYRYLDGEISEKVFIDSAGLWGNYKTDYAPLVKLAKENDYDFIATNIPRKYAAMVARKDFAILDSLSEEEKDLIPPTPIKYNPDWPEYKQIAEGGAGMPGHKLMYIAQAQAVKDAAMAWFIRENMAACEIFIHYNGRYHSDFKGGIYRYLKHLLPDISIKTITVVEQEDIDELKDEHKGRADYIICIDDDITRSY